MKKRVNAKRIAWGESADVWLLPKEKAVKGGRIVRVERRFRGQKGKFGEDEALKNFHAVKLARLIFPEHII